MALKTLGFLRLDLRSHLDEASARQWSDGELNRWLNEGARDIARRTEVLQTTSNVAVVASTQQYAMPTDLIRCYRVEWRPTGDSSVYPLEYRDFNSMDAVWWSQQTISTGDPAIFTLWGFPPSLNIVLYPTPSRAGTLKVFYYRYPSERRTDSETLDIPEGWHDLAVLYAEYVALRKDGDQRWVEAKQIYEEKLGELLDLTRRWTDQADSIQTATSVLPGWLVNPDF